LQTHGARLEDNAYATKVFVVELVVVVNRADENFIERDAMTASVVANSGNTEWLVFVIDVDVEIGEEACHVDVFDEVLELVGTLLVSGPTVDEGNVLSAFVFVDVIQNWKEAVNVMDEGDDAVVCGFV